MLKTLELPDVWRKPLIALLAVLSVFVWYFGQSWLSIVEIWQRSTTYTHGFLVLPASLWLIWTRKDVLKQLAPVPCYPVLMLLAVSGFLWLVAVLSKVQVVEQFATVAVLIFVIWAILGNRVVFSLLFPLLFLFLMVPFGADFVPYLMEYTASFVVTMLRLTGISVYREGLHFTLTSGQWSVVEACSGIRYLIASFTLGLIYSYLNYSSYLKRAAFILLSVLVPILANGVRAYLIVMIGHLSDMKLATGIDHIIYGWLFFGLVMLLLFYLGSFWQDQSATMPEAVSAVGAANSYPSSGFLYAGVTTLFFIIIWPMAADVL
ncbi:MAG: exosortase A, partial [Methylomonas sp.]|nr:exosortase A [Methylomonas sp.]